MSGQEMVLRRNKFICIMCGDRMSAEKNYITDKNLGVCRDCYNSLVKNEPSLPFEGTEHISYIMAPFEYSGGVRDAFLDYKFRGHYAYAPVFAKLMRQYIASYDIWEDFDYIVAVPLHKKRLRERGYNQSELIARHIADFLGIPIRTDILTRCVNTARQSGLDKLQRQANVQNAFKCNGADGGRIILFDDITTTGNTLEAAGRALSDGGAQHIAALTLAIHHIREKKEFMY